MWWILKLAYVLYYDCCEKCVGKKKTNGKQARRKSRSCPFVCWWIDFALAGKTLINKWLTLDAVKSDAKCSHLGQSLQIVTKTQQVSQPWQFYPDLSPQKAFPCFILLWLNSIGSCIAKKRQLVDDTDMAKETSFKHIRKQLSRYYQLPEQTAPD